MTSSAGPRATALCAILGAFALLVSACGGSDAEAKDKPSKSVASSASPSPTPTPTPTPAAEPLSPFEDKAPVKAARAYVRAVDLAINSGDKSLASVAPWATPAGIADTRAVMSDDLAHGYYLPGPEPFTPVSVQIKGATARLNLCFKTSGWSVNRKTSKAVGKPTIEPIIFEMRKVAGSWKYDKGALGTGDCGGVKVVETTW